MALAVVNIQTVPLRDCPGDILQHAYHHLDRLNRQYRTQIMLSESAKHCLLLHPWPGNIRELQNVLSSAYAMCEGELIEPENLPQRIAQLAPWSISSAGASAGQTGSGTGGESGKDGDDLSLKEKLNNYERILIREALDAGNGSMAAAARRLKIERSLLYKKMEKLGMK